MSNDTKDETILPGARDTERPDSEPTLSAPRLPDDEPFPKLPKTMPSPPFPVTQETELILKSMFELKSLVTLLGNASMDHSARLERIEADMAIVKRHGDGVREASSSAIDMAGEAIALGKTATKLAAGTYNFTKQIANHLSLELVDESDVTPNLELLAR